MSGPQLPHTYYNAPSGGAPSSFEATVVMFDLRKGALKELDELQELLARARGGLSIPLEKAGDIASRCIELEGTSGLEGLLKLLDILLDLKVASADLEKLSNRPREEIKEESRRLDLVFSHMKRNFRGDIGMDELAKLAGMSVSGFCSFFKRATRRTAMSLLHELRIDNACRLLIETDLPVAQIAFRSGYPTLSSFNRQFRRLQRCAPREYRWKTHPGRRAN